MNISILTLFPELYSPFLSTSLVRRAQENKHVAIDVLNLFTLARPKERVDSASFGHGAGVLIRPDVVEKGVNTQEAKFGSAYKIFFSPQGKKLDQRLLKQLYDDIQKKDHVMLLPARYEGMDARVEEHYADAVISVGDFVLMGGDLPAMVLLEGLLRYVPGIIGKPESVEHESFSGAFVDYPEYTEPVEWQGMTVPEVVRSGNHKELREWRLDQAAEKTVYHHFDWLRAHALLEEDKKRAARFIPSHYVALMHDQVMVPGNDEGTSSVTSIDVHDIARSAKTYGLKHYFIVTPLLDQQKIIQTLLDFWHTGVGVTYNTHRHDAVKQATLADSLDHVIGEIEAREGVKPLLIGTSAREVTGVTSITYYDQEEVWQHKRPVLLILGTARGLSEKLLARCDYVLVPLAGFSPFNHLSVRSAAAIIFDRWLGINLR